MLEEYVADYAIDCLVSSPVGEKLKKAMDAFERVQENLSALIDNNDEDRLTLMKCGTILTFAILKKLGSGTKIKDFSADDWKEIAVSVSQNAIFMNDQKYSESVFLLYAQYIDCSAENIEGKVSDKLVSSIRALAQELRDKTDALENAQISEIAYTEDCLWICLDAMIKLLSSSIIIVRLPYKKSNGTELEKVGEPSLSEELSVAITSFGFEYGRYKLYKKEQALITSYIENQHILDEELEQKYVWMNALAKTAAGNLQGKAKIDLETYVQTTYFDRILARANLRLQKMSGGQYDLKRRRNADDLKSKSGLELDIIDHINATERSVNTLSGGEAFLASLALALGLSDEVQMSTGIHLDTLFVDEGFGSLDSLALEQAISVLARLSDGDRLIGIISHVTELKDRVNRQIVVGRGSTGSTAKLIVG